MSHNIIHFFEMFKCKTLLYFVILLYFTGECIIHSSVHAYNKVFSTEIF